MKGERQGIVGQKAALSDAARVGGKQTLTAHYTSSLHVEQRRQQFPLAKSVSRKMGSPGLSLISHRRAGNASRTCAGEGRQSTSLSKAVCV